MTEFEAHGSDGAPDSASALPGTRLLTMRDLSPVGALWMNAMLP